MTLPWAAAIGPALLILFSAGEPGRVVKEDFSGKAPGKGWRVSSGAWRVEAGELHGTGVVHLELADPIDFTLT